MYIGKSALLLQIVKELYTMISKMSQKKLILYYNVPMCQNYAALECLEGSNRTS